MLDCPITTTSVEELAHQVNEGVVSLVFVSEVYITIPLHQTQFLVMAWTKQVHLGHSRSVFRGVRHSPKPQYTPHPTATTIRLFVPRILGSGSSFLPHISCTNSPASDSQCHYYNKTRPRNIIILMVISVLAVVGGLQTGMVFAIRPSYNDGNDTPVKSFGIISSILLSVALFPQYIEIYRHKEVIGISITFMVVDLLGGVFSDLSLAFKDEFDIIASISYSLVVVSASFILCMDKHIDTGI